MRSIIIDDEGRSRSTLATMLTRYCPDVELCGEASDIREAKALIESAAPELLFLDISMPGGSGFELLRTLPEIDFEVVFVTAYDEYTIDAIRNNAVDYLLKPVNIAELQKAVERVKQRLLKRQEQGSRGMNGEGEPASPQKKIAIPDKYGLRFIQVSDITRLEADGSYTTFFLSNGQKMVSSRHLKEFENILPSSTFFRAHHSYIINLDFVKHYERGEGGTIIMNDNSAIALSKRKKKFFLERFRI